MKTTASSTCKIRFNDCDMFGHLNNARYLDYLINARQDHLKDYYNFDFGSYYKNNLGWVISYHEISYLKPAFYDELVTIESSLLKVEDDALYVEVIMLNQGRTHLKAVLRSKLTFINIKTGKKERHQPEFMEWANALLNTEVAWQMPMQERIGQLLNELKEVKTA